MRSFSKRSSSNFCNRSVSKRSRSSLALTFSFKLRSAAARNLAPASSFFKDVGVALVGTVEEAFFIVAGSDDDVGLVEVIKWLFELEVEDIPDKSRGLPSLSCNIFNTKDLFSYKSLDDVFILHYKIFV